MSSKSVPSFYSPINPKYLNVDGKYLTLKQHLKADRLEARLYLADKPAVSLPAAAKKHQQIARVDEKKASLGNLTKSVNPPPAVFEEKYYNRFKLQDLSRKAIPEFRVKNCCRSRLSGADTITVKQSPSGYNYGNLQACGSVWVCPVCASRIVNGRRLELGDFIENVYKSGDHVTMLTLTIPHGFGDDLPTVLGGLLKSYKKMLNRKTWKGLAAQLSLVGTVRTLEVTHGKNGWHPHLHVLLVSKKSVDEIDNLSSRILSMWQSACMSTDVPCPNDHGVDVKICTRSSIADYVQKWGIDYEMVSGNTTKEAQGGNLSPFQILAASSNSNNHRRLFRHYAESFKGKRQLVYSEGLRKKYNCSPELTDEELLDLEDAKAVTIASIDLTGWKLLLATSSRGDFLDTLRATGGNVLEAAEAWGISQFVNVYHSCACCG